MSTVEEKESRKTALFDPQNGNTIVNPPGEGSGYWAGAPSVYFDAAKAKFYLSYRLRKPHPQRGSESRIAESIDGLKFTDIWSVRKEDLETSSMERSALMVIPNGEYRLYISYVDPVNNKWRIDMMESNDPRHFDNSKRRAILTADGMQVEGVKDPQFLVLDGKYYMFFSYAEKPSNGSAEQLSQWHATGDIFNTGKVKSKTGLAVSQDGISFKWLRDVLLLGTSWDSHTARVTCVLPVKNGFAVFYDGASDGERNYEESTGIATSSDLVRYERISRERPLLVSPYGSGSLRYLSAVGAGTDYYFYYECSRPDGSHDLRMNTVKKENLEALGVNS